ncbi:Alg9-like mannosyltransferase family-domain-containing protein [Lentinula raphanica]|nr:Alg9-like mannosyltransferase family-domain-containing protein [Lentinula raphanica]
MSILEDIAILLLGYLHVYLAPYTKVEESFNLHAVHDVLMYGVGTREGVDCYDHFKFPGPVPRTFIGSLVLAGVSYPVIWVLNLLGFVTKKYHLQVIVRITLSTLNALSLSFLRRSLSRRFGPRTSWCFTLLTLSQFHVPFWMSRTIPNMYAFGVVNVVSGIWVGVVGKGRERASGESKEVKGLIGSEQLKESKESKESTESEKPKESNTLEVSSAPSDSSELSQPSEASLSKESQKLKEEVKEEMKEENPWNTPEEVWGESSASSASSSPSAPSDTGESSTSSPPELEDSREESDTTNTSNTSNTSTSTSTSNATTTSNISNTSTTTTSPNPNPTKELQVSTITSTTSSSNSPSTEQSQQSEQCQKCQQATRSTNIERAIALLVFTAVVLRAEVVLLLGPVVLQSLALGYVGFWRVIWVGMGVGLVSIATTVAVDSFFWRELVWPEAKGILFNVVEGNSSQWGTSPIYTYIPLLLKLLLSSLPLSIFGCILDPTIREMLLPYVAFVGIISFLGHKEWRFVVYVVPVVNVGAARVGEWMTTQRNESKSKKSTLLSFIFYGMILLNVLKTVVTTVASIGNYPGGEALRRFDELIVPNGKPYHVHIANLAAQSGASLFLQEHAPPFPPSSLMSSTTSTTHNTHIPWYLSPPWVSSPNSPYTWTVYDKTENQTIDDLSRNTDITHLISEMSPVEMRSRMRIWKVVGAGLGGATGSGVAPSSPSAASAAAVGGAGGGSEDDIDVVYVDETKLVGVIYTTIPPGISEKALEVFEFGKGVAKGVGRVIKEGVRAAVRVLREAFVQVFRGGVQNDEDKGKEAVGIMEGIKGVLERMLETMEDLVGKVGWGWCWDWTEMGKSNWSWGGTASANESGNRKRSVSGWLKDVVLMRGIMKRKPVLWIYGRR